MIILEGVDNSGKSTVGRQIVDHMTTMTGNEFDLIHSPGPLDKAAGMVKWLVNELLEENPYAIHDRVSLISDVVYAPVVRKQLSYYVEKSIQQGMSQIIQDRPHLIIYCRPHMKTVLTNGGRDQMDGVIENHETLLKEYDVLMKRYQLKGFNVFEYDWEKGDNHFDELISRIMETHIRMLMFRKNMNTRNTQKEKGGKI